MLCVSAAAYACVVNDLPYPRLDCSLTDVGVTGGKGYTTVMCGDTIVVTIDVDESVDLRAVPFESMSINNQEVATISYADGRQLNAGDKWNLRAGEVLVANAYDYLTYYRMEGVQTVSKRFSVEGQIGETYIEELEGFGLENRVVMVSVAKGADFSAINVLELKLGPEGETTITPEIKGITDFTAESGEDHIKEVTVSYRDVVQTWRIIVQESSTDVSRVDTWATSADIYCTGGPEEAHSIEYRLKGVEEWTVATLESDEGGVFVAKIDSLAPATEYECRAVSGDEQSGVVSFTTEEIILLLDGGFENWHKSGSTWFPYAEGAAGFWDTGNSGATTLGEDWNITTQREDPRPGSEGAYCAHLQSAFPSMFGIGKFAAGNIYVGRYAGTNGTNGVVEFGQPFTSRPKALRGWYKCNVGQINKTGAGAPVTSGSDRYQIMICLTNGIHTVNTADKSTFFNCKTDSKVIAYGEILGSESVEEWTEFTLPLTYVKPDERPTHIIVVATASSYGDYFTGSTDSWMCVDDFELVY